MAQTKSSTVNANTIPNWLRAMSLLWFLFWFPVYWRTWGASNFLQMCDIAVILTCVGIWSGSGLLISSQAVSSIVVDLVWMVDAASRFLFGRHVLGGTEYLFEAQVPLWVRLLSLFHLGLLVIFWDVFRRNGYDRRGYVLQCAIALPIFAASRFRPPAKNMNFAFADPFFHKQWGPGPIHVLVIWLFMVVVVYLPTHLLLARLFPTTRVEHRIHASH